MLVSEMRRPSRMMRSLFSFSIPTSFLRDAVMLAPTSGWKIARALAISVSSASSFSLVIWRRRFFSSPSSTASSSASESVPGGAGAPGSRLRRISSRTRLIRPSSSSEMTVWLRPLPPGFFVRYAYILSPSGAAPAAGCPSFGNTVSRQRRVTSFSAAVIAANALCPSSGVFPSRPAGAGAVTGCSRGARFTWGPEVRTGAADAARRKSSFEPARPEATASGAGVVNPSPAAHDGRGSCHRRSMPRDVTSCDLERIVGFLRSARPPSFPEDTGFYYMQRLLRRISLLSRP